MRVNEILEQSSPKQYAITITYMHGGEFMTQYFKQPTNLEAAQMLNQIIVTDKSMLPTLYNSPEEVKQAVLEVRKACRNIQNYVFYTFESYTEIFAKPVIWTGEYPSSSFIAKHRQ